MTKFKIVIIAGGLALLVNNLSFLLFFGGVFIGQWLLYPAIYLADIIDPGYLRIVAFYMLGFIQFFIFLLIILGTVFFLKKSQPPAR